MGRLCTGASYATCADRDAEVIFVTPGVMADEWRWTWVRDGDVVREGCCASAEEARAAAEAAVVEPHAAHWPSGVAVGSGERSDEKEVDTRSAALPSYRCALCRTPLAVAVHPCAGCSAKYGEGDRPANPLPRPGSAVAEAAQARVDAILRRDDEIQGRSIAEPVQATEAKAQPFHIDRVRAKLDAGEAPPCGACGMAYPDVPRAVFGRTGGGWRAACLDGEGCLARQAKQSGKRAETGIPPTVDAVLKAAITWEEAETMVTRGASPAMSGLDSMRQKLIVKVRDHMRAMAMPEKSEGNRG